MNSNLPVLIPVPQSKSFVGLARSTVYRLASEGRLKLLKVDGRTFIDRASFEAFLASLPVVDVKPALRGAWK